MKRRSFLGTSAAALAVGAAGTAAAEPVKTISYAFKVAETGFDPAKITDIYSRIITSHMFEGLVGYDHLARPATIKPVLAAALPEVSEDFRVWTFHIRPGVFFADDPAFKGSKREVVAEDFVYSLKRIADPATISPSWDELESLGLVGLKKYRDSVREAPGSGGAARFDYAHPIEGLRALDRYTLRIVLDETRPRMLQILAQSDLYGVVAREVIEAYPDATSDHPVGTGPFMLKDWRRSSQMVLVRNPGYRERYYRDEVHPAPDDAEGQALLARFKDRRLPMIDRVEIAIIQETQPRWLSFLDGQFDFMEKTPEDFITEALPAGKLAPKLARKGVQAFHVPAPDSVYHAFNMEDPVVGGYTPERVALRRAFALAIDSPREIKTVRRGQGLLAQGYIVPETSSYEPQFKSEMSEYDPARARALLDLYGYVDRDGDGWRERPDGSPLVIESLTTPDAFQRQCDELYQKNLAAIGVRLRFKVGQWPDNLKAMRAGNFQLWSLGGSASMADAQDLLAAYTTSHIGTYNYARFSLPAMDKIFDRTALLPDGPERAALFHQSELLAVAYMPYKHRLHRYITDLAWPQLQGFRRGPFWLNWWEYADIDETRRHSSQSS
ncbi:MAG TPA: ABC transporter substrate-binding protein [Burkholderiaceae bacterium]